MQVGDLVRVYDFTKKARQRLPGNDEYTLGLIVGEGSRLRSQRGTQSWRVQLLQHPEYREIYQDTRLEVESANR